MYAGLVNATSAPERRTQSGGASPWTYTNNSSVPERIIVTAGSISLIEMQFDRTSWDSALGLVTGGWFLLNPGESLRFTWLITAPVLSICPF